VTKKQKLELIWIGKSWRYALIPHTTISENMTFVALAQQFIGRAVKEED
jgi:hypothetical protein